MLLIVTKREVYGSTRYYPVNNAAQQAADLIGTKTLSMDAMLGLKSLGHDIELELSSDLPSFLKFQAS